MSISMYRLKKVKDQQAQLQAYSSSEKVRNPSASWIENKFFSMAGIKTQKEE